MPMLTECARTDGRTGVLRVRLSRAGLSELSAAEVRGHPLSAELLDAGGAVCGRARRLADPASSRFSDGFVWHVQIGGTLLGGEWAGRPMGCGCGTTALEAAMGARDDLIRRASEMARQAERIGGMIGR